LRPSNLLISNLLIMPLVDDQTRQQIVSRVLAARDRRADFLIEMAERQRHGWEIARRVAALLKADFGAQRVVLFGSMLNSETMTWHSDLDLAVWGLSPEAYLRAGVAAEKGHGFSIDLIDAQSAPAHILAAIDQGTDL
jgi:uncharacterized protein